MRKGSCHSRQYTYTLKSLYIEVFRGLVAKDHADLVDSLVPDVSPATHEPIEDISSCTSRKSFEVVDAWRSLESSLLIMGLDSL